MVSQTRTAKRTPAARHFGGGIHRSHGSKGPKPKYLYATTEIPQPESIAVAENTTVYYADGTTPIGTFSEQNREIIDCSVLPDYVGQAVVASEDRSFYTNRGIDLVGIARAFWNNLTTGSRQGGSTITQQYAERYYLGETTSYLGKAREAILALKIAQAQDKDQVLCNYMNTIYLGRGTYLRHPGRGQGLLRQGRQGPDHAGGGHDRRHHPLPVVLGSSRRPRTGAGPIHACAAHHAGGRLHHRAGAAGGSRRPSSRRPSSTRSRTPIRERTATCCRWYATN